MNRFAVVLLLLLTFVACDTRTRQQRLDQAQQNLTADSPTTVQMLADLKRAGVTFTIVLADLPDTAQEATTAISSDASPIITIDEARITRAMDRIEPVLAHEIAHVHQAYLFYGVERFSQIVNVEKQLRWDHRTVEKSAIVVEDQVRAELKRFKEFKSLPPKRQDILAHHG